MLHRLAVLNPMISSAQNAKALRRLTRGRKQRAAANQANIALSAAEVWRDRFIDQAAAFPDLEPLDHLGARYLNASNGCLRPDAKPFDFDRFQGFGLFLNTLHPKD